MKNNTLSIKDFLTTSPSVSSILQYVEDSAQAIAAEQRKEEQHATK